MGSSGIGEGLRCLSSAAGGGGEARIRIQNKFNNHVLEEAERVVFIDI
jgi:hypothetical protein